MTPAWPTSSCPACPTRWRRARSSSGSSPTATRSSAARSSSRSRPTRPTMTYEADRRACSRSSPRRATRSPVGAGHRRDRRRRDARRRRGAERPRRPRARARRRPRRAAPSRQPRHSPRRHPSRSPRAATADAAPPRRGDGGRVKASPVARRMAREQGVELSSSRAPARRADREGRRRGRRRRRRAASGGRPAARQPPAAAEPARAPEPAAPAAASTAKGDVTTEELTRLQQDDRAPDGRVEGDGARVRDHDEVDMEAAVELRNQLKAAAATARAVVQRLRRQGVARWRCASSRAPTAPTATAGSSSTRASTSASPSPRQDALVVPTVFDADRKSLGEIAREARALAERVRAGAITPPELGGGTFTVSNLGMYGDHALRGRHQPAAGGDPRGRRADAAAGRARRRGRRRAT